jgi:hypothetical protein
MPIDAYLYPQTLQPGDVVSAGAALARVDAEGKNAARARKELDRVRRLAASDSASQQSLDDAALNFDTAEIALREAVVRIPRYSVLRDDIGSYFVLKVVGNESSKVAVELGIADDIQVEVRAGLRAGDRIVRAPDVSQAR